MTFRALLGVIITTLLLVGGGFLILRHFGASIDDYSDALFFQADENRLRCFFFALGALLSGLFAILSNFPVFADVDEEDIDRDEFPFGAIPFFLIVSLILFAFSLRCAAPAAVEILDDATASTPVAPVAAPAEEPVVEPEALIEEPEPIADPEPVLPPAPPPPPEPTVSDVSAARAWPYKYPLVRDGAHVPSSVDQRFLATVFPSDDPQASVSSLLCGKAWIAVTGASSQEGPALRNETRARLRAELAAAAARQWLDAAPPSCRQPVILGVSLGQHLPTVENGDVGTDATAYQRQVMFVSRARAADGAPVTGSDAMEELQTFLGSEAGARALLGSRAYHSAPSAFSPRQ